MRSGPTSIDQINGTLVARANPRREDLPPGRQMRQRSSDPEQVAEAVDGHHDDVLRGLRGYEIGE